MDDEVDLATAARSSADERRIRAPAAARAGAAIGRQTPRAPCDPLGVRETEDIDLPDAVTTKPLHLTVDPVWDHLCALEFGRVSDGWAHDCRLQLLGTDLLFLLATPTGPVVGIEIWGWNDFEVPEDAAEVWDGPRFDVPRLGLEQASVGEVLTAARAQFPDGPTVDAHLFHLALDEPDLETKLLLWESCLDAGDMKAHFGWGCVLLDEAGRPHAAYSHLRRYTELAPVNAWAWHWRAQACEALGERDEARACYRRAIACEPICGMETDAEERLERLERLERTTGP